MGIVREKNLSIRNCLQTKKILCTYLVIYSRDPLNENLP